MNKQSLVATREGMLNTLAYMAGAGLLTGGAMSAWNALSRHLERKKQEKNQKNMIVIELPADRLAKTSEAKVPNSKISIPRSRKEGTTQKAIKLTYNNQYRSTDGQFGNTLAKSGALDAPTGTLPRAGYAIGSILGGAGAFAGGYALMTALYNRLKEKRMEDEAETYRQKYMKTLIEKGAAPLESLARVGTGLADLGWGVVKGVGGALRTTADVGAGGARMLDALRERNLDPLSATVTVGGVLAALGLGTSAFLTKKYLDAKLGDKMKPLDTVPRRKRIVFRAAKPAQTAADERPPTEPAEHPTFEEGSEKTSQDLFLGALAVELVKQADGADYFLTDHVKDTLRTAGFSEDTLYKAASSDVSPLDLECLENPAVQDMLVRNVIAGDPCLVELRKMADEKSAVIVDDVTKDLVNEVVNTIGGSEPDPMQGAMMTEAPVMVDKDDVPMPGLSTEEFLVTADNPQIAKFLTKNRAAVSKRLKVPRPKRTKETVNASRKQIPAKADGDGTRVPEGGAQEPTQED